MQARHHRNQFHFSKKPFNKSLIRSVKYVRFSCSLERLVDLCWYYFCKLNFFKTKLKLKFFQQMKTILVSHKSMQYIFLTSHLPCSLDTNQSRMKNKLFPKQNWGEWQWKFTAFVPCEWKTTIITIKKLHAIQYANENQTAVAAGLLQKRENISNIDTAF